VGFRFPPDVIIVAIRWYLRYSVSYRDAEELLAERGITVGHVTIFRWVQRFSRHCCIERSVHPSWSGCPPEATLQAFECPVS
jgi:transposase-like protein